MTIGEKELQESVEKLREISKVVYKSYHDHAFLVQQLNEITPAGRNELLNKYQNAKGPVTLIRKQVAEILRDRSITLDELQTIADDAKAKSPKSFSRMYIEWYNILYMFVLNNHKKSIEQSISTIKKNVSGILGNPNYLSSVSFDFSGERQTGSTRLWIAFYNSGHNNQSTAKQLFLLIENGYLLYSFYDRPQNVHTGKHDLQDGTQFNVDDMLTLFKSHLKEIESDNVNVISQINLQQGQNVFKISMGPNDIDEEVYQYLLSDNLVMVHKDTKALGTSSDKQGDEFTKSMKKGDYFYLCRGNRMVLIGTITGDIEKVEYQDRGDNGWVQRSFEKKYDSVKEDRYEEKPKWWSPNFRSTCWPIPLSEMDFANEKLFEPFFKVKFIMDKNDQPTNNPTDKIIADTELNKILYGPPGTGKTFRMMELIKSSGVIEEIDAKKPDYDTFVSNYNWWELISLVLLDKKKATVPQIMDHELIKSKLGISNIQFPPQRIWGTLQSHTVLECPNVKTNEDNRHGELIFFKEGDSVWRLNDENEFKLQFPFLVEAFENLNKTDDLLKVKKHFTFTTCHQSLSYEDFIEGIKPVLIDSTLEEDNIPVQYEIRKGYFYQACEKAAQRAGYLNLSEALNDTYLNRRDKFNEAKIKNQIYIIFLDEINRCNVSSVFGELITLIEDDKRLGAKNEIADTLLPYSQTVFGVPSNLYIVGTMNTADRSIEALDTALRRRFSFEFMPPEVEKVCDFDINGISLKKIFSQINERISFLLDSDHQLGHSYFMDVQDANQLRHIFKNKIIPLLKEYFYNDYRKIYLVLGEGFVERTENKKPEFAVKNDDELDRDIYKIIPIEAAFNIYDALTKTYAK